jgi:hypothetical protein
VVVIADALTDVADAMRRVSGMPEYQFCVTAYPVGNLTPDEVDRRAASLAPVARRLLVEGRTPEPDGATSTAPPRWARFDDEGAALEALHSDGWTDGLPVVIPTRPRVDAFLAAAGRDPDEVVVRLPTRNGLAATVRDVAAAAVMAGCRAVDLRVVLAALDAAARPAYNLHAHTATMAGAAQVLVVNGPIRHELGLATGNGALGPGWRANASIGRAVRLVIRNQLGSRPGEFDRAGFSTPARVGWCIAEAEESSPFASLAERASGIAGDAVSVYATTWQASVICHERSAEALLDELGLAVRTACHTNWLHHAVASESSFFATRPFLFVTGHEHARVLTAGGYDDEARLQVALFDRLVRDDAALRPVAVADPARLHFAYVHATGMQQTWFFAPFQSHELVTAAIA